MKAIKTVGVVGAGTMGSALAQKFAMEGFRVFLADRSIELTEKGIRNISASLDEGIARKVFTPEKVEEILKNIQGTEKLEDLRVCDLVIEAIYENFEAKVDLFAKLSKFLSKKCILATNTSSYSVTELAGAVEFPDRFIGLHFFYHAAKNRLVEIIPGAETSRETFEMARRFVILAGKDPITCADMYGFVVNRFFVPWLNEAVRLYQEGVASIKLIDETCCSLFGIGIGPFALMNATGVPVAYHAEKTLEVFGQLYMVARALKEQALEGKSWDIETNADSHAPGAEQIIRDRMLGVVLFVCSQILDKGLCTPTDLNRGARIGLKWKRGPVEIMRSLGVDEVNRLVTDIAKRYSMKMPISIGEEFWKMKYVKVTRNGDAATITMDQPESMNALSEETIRQLWDCFNEVESDTQINTIFITGSGKAFVAGADIKFFVDNMKKDRICDIESFTGMAQRVFERIDRSRKKVVAVLNGLTLGGGLELALCADVILATPTTKLAFPETGIGIYPGLGGTQRTTWRIGIGLSKYLVLTGRMLSAQEAEEIGLVNKVVTMQDAFAILGNEIPIPKSRRISLSPKWKAIGSYFWKNSLEEIMNRTCKSFDLPDTDTEKIVRSLSTKAPVALRTADSLITEGKGPQSELEHLRSIFSTKDAFEGLTHIGEKVKFSGS